MLYVAKFDADGWGEWLPLTPDNPDLAGWSLNDILINTRGAADVVGATPMDRPEWIDSFSRHLTVVATLTNNTPAWRSRHEPATLQPNPGADAANPRAPNPYGHIIRWAYEHDFDEPMFYWDLFALGGDPAVPAHGSTIVGDKYGSPDGIYVAPSGRLWIQTDVSTSTVNSGAYAGFGNNQMLGADPTTKETRRFLVGPNTCEITGAMTTPDERTMFVGIQHPGEGPSGNHSNPANPKAFSSWPDGPAGGRPRSCAARDHEGRRRQDRHLKAASVRRNRLTTHDCYGQNAGSGSALLLGRLLGGALAPLALVHGGDPGNGDLVALCDEIRREALR